MTRAWIATALGLVFWVALGVLVTTWYDRRGLYRIPPDLMEHIDQAVLAYQTEKSEAGSARLDPDDVSVPAGDSAPDEPVR